MSTAAVADIESQVREVSDAEVSTFRCRAQPD